MSNSLQTIATVFSRPVSIILFFFVQENGYALSWKCVQNCFKSECFFFFLQTIRWCWLNSPYFIWTGSESEKHNSSWNQTLDLSCIAPPPPLQATKLHSRPAVTWNTTAIHHRSEGDGQKLLLSHYNSNFLILHECVRLLVLQRTFKSLLLVAHSCYTSTRNVSYEAWIHAFVTITFCQPATFDHVSISNNTWESHKNQTCIFGSWDRRIFWLSFIAKWWNMINVHWLSTERNTKSLHLKKYPRQDCCIRSHNRPKSQVFVLKTSLKSETLNVKSFQVVSTTMHLNVKCK